MHAVVVAATVLWGNISVWFCLDGVVVSIVSQKSPSQRNGACLFLLKRRNDRIGAATSWRPNSSWENESE